MTSRRGIRAVALGCVLGVLANTSPALDVDRHIAQYAHSSWRSQDGFFGDTPHAIAQTTDGYLWVGTGAGLSRFDGAKVVPFNEATQAALPPVGVSALLGTPEGNLWIGTESGLYRWDGHTLTEYSTNNQFVTAVVLDAAGTIWVALATRTREARGGICKVEGQELRCYGSPEGIPFEIGCCTTAGVDLHGQLWLGSSTSLVRRVAANFEPASVPGLPPDEAGIKALEADTDGSLLVGMQSVGKGLGLQRLTNGVWATIRSGSFDSSKIVVSALLKDSDGALWVGTANRGVFRIVGNAIDHFDHADGLSGDSVTALYRDREGSLWVTTSAGVDSFHDIAITTWSRREGLDTEFADAVLARRDGTILVGGTQYLYARRPADGSTFHVVPGLPIGQITSLLEDHDGRLWVGIDDGLWRYEPGHLLALQRPNEKSLGMVVAMAQEPGGDIWAKTIGADPALLRIRSAQVVQSIYAPQIPGERHLAGDTHDGLWLGLNDGTLAKYQNAHLEQFPSISPKNPHAIKYGSLVNQVAVMADGSTIAATASGLIRWQAGTQQLLSMKNGMPCDSIYSLVQDERDSIWLSARCGLIKITNAELKKWWNDPSVVIELQTFDELDGFRPGLAHFNSSAISADGQLWFANSQSLQSIDPARLHRNQTIPPVYIEGVVGDGRRYRPADHLQIPPGTRDLEFDYTALSFIAPRKVRFKYQLVGHDATWQDPGIRREAMYNDLKPRDYQFRVIACNNDGVWNETGASLDFTVLPMWYQLLWVQILFGVGLVVAAWFFYRARMRSLAKSMMLRFDERLADRTRLARDLHDTLLQTIQVSKMVADEALYPVEDASRLRTAVERVSHWLGQAILEGRAALNSLRMASEETNDLKLSLQQVSDEIVGHYPMTVSFSVLGDVKQLHPIARHEIFLIASEAIRNAHAHSKGKRLEVTIDYGRDLCLRICDDGRGMDLGTAAGKKTGHFGLQGMRERAARIHGQLTITTSSASGTRVILTIPGKIVFGAT